MKIIDATWEKRNLGVDTIEIEVEKTDKLFDVKRTIEDMDAQYIVVKIPVGNYQLMKVLEKAGYSFIECQMRTEGNRKTYLQTPSYAIIPAIKKLNKICTYSKMNNNDLEILYREIDDSLFNTDRIYLDPFFHEGQEAFRYKMWIMDEIEKGFAEAFKVEYHSDTIGFFVHKEIAPKTYKGLLMGVYGAYKDTGFGYIVDLKEREEHSRKECRSIGYISSNNIARVKLSFSEPSILTDIQYVYIKHQ